MHSDVRARLITARGPTDKTVVLGILERGGLVRTQVVGNRKKRTLQREVRLPWRPARPSTATTWHPTRASADYAHQTVNHAIQYVDGRVHTNSLENSWSLLQRALNGTYVSVEPFHLPVPLPGRTSVPLQRAPRSGPRPFPAGDPWDHREAPHVRPSPRQDASRQEAGTRCNRASQILAIGRQKTLALH